MANKSYVERDIEVLRNKLIQMVKDETTSWTDFNETDLGMVYIEVLAGCADMLNYYLDKQANEVFLDRAEEPKNIRSILNTMNYRIPFKKPAEGTIRVINPEGLIGNDVVIKKYTQFTTSQEDAMKFVSKEERVLVGGEESVDIPVIQGIKISTSETVGRLKRNWKHFLKTKSLADRSVRVIDSYGEWEEVDDAFLEYKGGRKFSVHRDARDNPYILFTWDWKNQLPNDEGEVVSIQYVETLGEEGNTGEFMIDKVTEIIYDVEGNDVTKALIINNLEPITGGVGEPSIYKMIVDAKNNIKMMGKLVTLEDYANAALAYSGIYKAVTQDWSVPNNSVNKAYKVITWAVSHDGEPFSSSFLETMSKDLQDRGIAIVEYEVVQAEIVNFDVSAQIKIKSDDVEFRARIRRQVIQNLTEAFGYGKMEFGQHIIWDDIRDVIKRTNGAITNVAMIEPNVDRTLSPIQYPVIGSIDIEIVGDYYGL